MQKGEHMTDKPIVAKILTLDLAEPYVWRLHLTLDEFKQLEELLSHKESVVLRNNQPQTYALLVMAYIAEGYKRYYNTAEAGRLLHWRTDELKQIWKDSGIRTERFLYSTEAGNVLWNYSIYVLGGLSIPLELGRHDSGRFLRALCGIYHGETDDGRIITLGGVGRAQAFTSSIRDEGSLYYYIKEIVGGSYKSEDEQEQQLLTAVRHANDEVWRAKFHLEWRIVYPQGGCDLRRKLRIWLKPEAAGGTMHQYLHFDRVRAWGMTNPAECKSIYFGLQWRCNEHIVQAMDKKRPLMSFLNSGGDEGFVVFGVDRYAVSKDVPTRAFNIIDIIAYDGLGNEWIVQEETVASWMQLWRESDFCDEWSSDLSSQHQTAVVYTSQCHADISPTTSLPFYCKKYGLSDLWNWNYISTQITIVDENNIAHDLYNREGYDFLHASLYDDVICYVDGSYVKYTYADTNESEYLPVVFRKEDVMLRHMNIKDDDSSVTEDIVCDSIEYKDANGRYTIWSENNAPKYGVVQLRCEVKNQFLQLRVVYLPLGIERDCEKRLILYKDVNGKQIEVKDYIVDDFTPLLPTITIHLGGAEIDVYRPTTIKEIYLDNKVHTYCTEEKPIVLPYILKNRVMIADYGTHGYRHYNCSNLSTLFTSYYLGENKNSMMALWKEGKEWDASLLDGNAPRWLKVCFGNMQQPFTGGDYYRFCPAIDTEPIPIHGGDIKVERGVVVFKDMRNPDKDFFNPYPKQMPPNPFAKKASTTAAELSCFLTACEYQIYFEIFQPIRNMIDKKEVMTKLVEPLSIMFSNELPTHIVKGLLRLREEFPLNNDKLFNSWIENQQNNK